MARGLKTLPHASLRRGVRPDYKRLSHLLGDPFNEWHRTYELLGISPDIMYRLEEAKRVMGWGNHAMRSARRNGLIVKYAGRRAYVHGKHLIEYIEQQGRDAK